METERLRGFSRLDEKPGAWRSWGRLAAVAGMAVCALAVGGIGFWLAWFVGFEEIFRFLLASIVGACFCLVGVFALAALAIAIRG